MESEEETGTDYSYVPEESEDEEEEEEEGEEEEEEDEEMSEDELSEQGQDEEKEEEAEEDESEDEEEEMPQIREVSVMLRDILLNTSPCNSRIGNNELVICLTHLFSL